MYKMSNRYIELVPTNVPSDGKISFKNGHPVIQFIIGASDFLLLGSSVRLCVEQVSSVLLTRWLLKT